MTIFSILSFIQQPNNQQTAKISKHKTIAREGENCKWWKWRPVYSLLKCSPLFSGPSKWPFSFSFSLLSFVHKLTNKSNRQKMLLLGPGKQWYGMDEKNAHFNSHYFTDIFLCLSISKSDAKQSSPSSFTVKWHGQLLLLFSWW